MTIFYLITTFVVLLACAEVADKATSGAQHLPDQGAAASREGWLAGQRSGGMGRDLWVVDVYRVQNHLRAETTEPIKQVVDALLRTRRSHLQDPEAVRIHSFSLSISFSY
jgi:hypothetical protein